MSNYKEEIKEITGQEISHVRAKRVVVSNPYKQIPSLAFIEEKVVNKPDGSVVYEKAEHFCLREDFLEMDQTFDKLNPETNEVIGSYDKTEIQIILHSLYFHMVSKRDAETEEE